MIGSHCGTKLQPLGDWMANRKKGYHRWWCPICKREFRQRIRKGKK